MKKSRKREILARRQGGMCCWCKEPLGDDMSLEHIECTANGGANSLVNLAVAHRSCNSRRGNIPLIDIIMAMPPVKFNKGKIKI